MPARNTCIHRCCVHARNGIGVCAAVNVVCLLEIYIGAVCLLEIYIGAVCMLEIYIGLCALEIGIGVVFQQK